MLEILNVWLCRSVGTVFLTFWVVPAAVLFLSYVLYIVVKTILEFRKK